VGIENFDQLLKQAFSKEVDNSRLRHLMSNETKIMLVATAAQGDFDTKYDERMFLQFQHANLTPWRSEEHRIYLARRAHLIGVQVTPALPRFWQTLFWS
jgi:hypothetical protein